MLKSTTNSSMLMSTRHDDDEEKGVEDGRMCLVSMLRGDGDF